MHQQYMLTKMSIADVLATGHPSHMIQEHIDFTSSSPFDLDDTEAYSRWREWKIAHSTTDARDLVVDIADPLALSDDELARLRVLAETNNMAIYRLLDPHFTDKDLVHELGRQLHMTRLDNNLRADEDSVTSLEVRSQSGNQYIPYTNKGLSWHTDGYYNAMDQQVRGVILHCVTPAVDGGENALIDHDQMYIRLRDEDPELIRALMHPEAMTIPPNIEAGVELRPAQSGPVFSVEPVSGHLHMRYSARKRNIVWRDDEVTSRAADRITGLLADETLICRYRLKAGEGIIGNNVLHNRTGFEDSLSQKRLMYRARYFDRMR